MIDATDEARGVPLFNIQYKPRDIATFDSYSQKAFSWHFVISLSNFSFEPYFLVLVTNDSE
jgi:hypothetical protein